MIACMRAFVSVIVYYDNINVCLCVALNHTQCSRKLTTSSVERQRIEVY